MTRISKSAIGLCLTVLLIATFSVTAHAQMVYACVDNVTGLVWVEKTPGMCNPTQTQMSWSQGWTSDQQSQVIGPNWIIVPTYSTSLTPLQSITVKAPANGNMIVTAAGSVTWEFTTGVNADWCLQLSQTPGYVRGCAPDLGTDSAIRFYTAADFPTTMNGYGETTPYSIVRSWPVTAGASYTFYLNGWENNYNGVWLFHPSLTVLYAPGTLAP
jgi:hypothetical protein